jgi:hypothetical protein
MKKLSLVLSLVLLAAAAPMLAQNASAVTGSYYNTYYSNNINPLVADQVVRAINVGAHGVTINNPESGVGDICENVFVFDSNQEMIACCACRLTPNELSSAFVGSQLTNHALTGTAPVSGVVKVLFTRPDPVNGPTGCRAETSAATELGLGAVFSTHLEAEPPSSPTSLFVHGEQNLPQVLSAGEFAFLTNACMFVRYLGSGTPGSCSCSAGFNAR